MRSGRTPRGFACQTVRGILGIAAALLVAACYVPSTDAPDPRYFQVESPRVGAAAPVPGQVADVTATVVGAEVDRRSPPIVGLNDTFVAPVAGRPNALVVGWLGGSCDARFDLELRLGGDGRPSFTLKLLTRPEACDLIGVPRRLILTFERVVDAADFRLDVVR